MGFNGRGQQSQGRTTITKLDDETEFENGCNYTDTMSNKPYATWFKDDPEDDPEEASKNGHGCFRRGEAKERQPTRFTSQVPERRKKNPQQREKKKKTKKKKEDGNQTCNHTVAARDERFYHWTI